MTPLQRLLCCVDSASGASAGVVATWIRNPGWRASREDCEAATGPARGPAGRHSSRLRPSSIPSPSASTAPLSGHFDEMGGNIGRAENNWFSVRAP